MAVKRPSPRVYPEDKVCLLTAINPWPPVLYLSYTPPDWSFVVTVNTSVHVQVFTVTLFSTAM